MAVTVTVPINMYQGVLNELTRRGGLISNSEPQGDIFLMEAKIPLSKMFGYTTDLRSMSQGRASFTMEFYHFAPVEVKGT